MPIVFLIETSSPRKRIPIAELNTINIPKIGTTTLTGPFDKARKYAIAPIARKMPAM